MDKFGIVEAVKAECLAADVHFVLSFDEFQNNIQTNFDNADGKSILIFDFRAKPIRELGRVMSINYDCLFSLGRKFDPNEDTSAQLAETHQQKYDRRIKPLMDSLDSIISNIQCNNNLKSSGEDYDFELNVYNLGADFVVSPVSFTQNV